MNKMSLNLDDMCAKSDSYSTPLQTQKYNEREMDFMVENLVAYDGRSVPDVGLTNNVFNF